MTEETEINKSADTVTQLLKLCVLRTDVMQINLCYSMQCCINCTSELLCGSGNKPRLGKVTMPCHYDTQGEILYFYCLHPVACITIKKHKDLKCVQPSNATIFLLINIKSALHVLTLKGSFTCVRCIHSLIIDFLTRDLTSHQLPSRFVFQ